VQSNLKRLQAINCYRGIRHRRGLPVHLDQRPDPQRSTQDRRRDSQQGCQGRQGLTLTN
jgi:small subunit ribosomal protein S13